MTTNIGSHLIQENFERMTPETEEFVLEETKGQVFELLRRSVRPEFLNRVDELIMFRPLSQKDIRKIVDIQFRHIQKRLEENGIKIEATDDVLDHLGKAGFDPQFGARPLKRVLQREILNELSKEILSGRISKDAVVAITMADNHRIQFMNLDEVNIGE